VERVRFGLRWRELLRWRRAGWAELDRPVLHVLQRRQPRPAAPPGEPQHVDEAPRGGRRVAGLAPFRIERTQVREGRILFARASAPEAPILRIHGVELVLESFVPPGAPAGGHRMVLTARATLQRSGRISLLATADPGAARPTFSGHARLEGLRFDELGATLARTGVEPDGGVVAMVVRFSATDGRISGDVRPILSAADTRPEDPGIASHLKSLLADGSLDQFREDVRGGADPATTTIRLDGTVKDPAAHPVTAIVGVLRNAFVVGLTAALRGPPPAASVEPPRDRGQARRPPPRGSRGRQATAR
jgi:hypothetical protein